MGKLPLEEATAPKSFSRGEFGTIQPILTRDLDVPVTVIGAMFT